MAMVDITDANFEEEVLQSDMPVLVDFWAPWCGPCRAAGPVLESLSEKYDGKIKFVKVNVDENPSSPGKYGVMGIPTTILFAGGQEVSRKTGFVGEAGYEELLGLASK